MCLICLFIVKKKSTQKYTTRMGQNTGTSKTEKNVMPIAVKKMYTHENVKKEETKKTSVVFAILLRCVNPASLVCLFKPCFGFHIRSCDVGNGTVVTDHDGLATRVPELVFWKSPDKWFELRCIVTAGQQR